MQTSGIYFQLLISAVISCNQLYSAVAVAVVVQLATEMALNSKVGRSAGWLVVTLFGNPNKSTAIAIVISIWNLGNLGSWKFGTLGIWDLGKLGILQFGILGIKDCQNMGSWVFGILVIWKLWILVYWEFGIMGIWDLRELFQKKKYQTSDRV